MPKIKVLYAEDELFLGKIVKESLETRGFEVLMESDGARVLPSFKKMRPDVCVLGVMLPNKEGFDTPKNPRTPKKKNPNPLLTPKVRTKNVVKGCTRGGNDYI